jgi:multiple sugar transport system substrate-binding protein
MNHTRGLSRRDFLRLTAAVTPVAMAAACAPAAPQIVEVEKPVIVEKEVIKEVPVDRVVEKAVVVEKPAKREQKVEIEWWHGWGGTTGVNALTAVADAFNLEDRPVYVHRLQVPEMNDKLLAAIAGGTPPDVGVCCIRYEQYYARGSFTPIDDYVAASDVVDPADFLPTFVNSMTWQGKLYGVPACECGPRFGLLYNRDLLKEFGVDEDDLPETWGDMAEMLLKISRFDDAGNIEVVGFDALGGTAERPPTPNISMFWGENFGMDVWDEDALAFQFWSPEDDRLVQALELVKEFYDMLGGVEKIVNFNGSFTGGSQSPTGSFPMGALTTQVYGYWAAGELPHSSPDLDFHVTWVPVPEERRGTKCQGTGGHPIYIPVGAKHPDAAWEFMEWITTPKACKIIFEQTGWFGGRAEYYDPGHPWVADNPALQWFLESAAIADDSWENPVIPNGSFVANEWTRLREKVIYGEMTAEEAAKALQKNCTDDLHEEFPELFGG